MRILITGSSGYIGGRLIEHLKDKHELKLPNRAELVFSETYENIDAVIHLAGANKDQCSEHFTDAIYINCALTNRICNLANRNGVNRIIFASTSHVYGKQNKMSPSSACFPINNYGITKLASESIIRNSGMEHVILRLANGFGYPANKPSSNHWSNLVINQAVKSMVKNNKATLVTNGMRVINFVPMYDIVRAFEHSLDCRQGTYNIGNMESTVLGMVIYAANIVKEKLKTNPVIEKCDSKSGLLLQSGYDCSESKREGFKFTRSFKREINGLIKYCQQ